MSRTLRTTQPSGLGSVAVSGKVFSLSDVSTKDKPLPNRYGIHALPGFGKTSIAAYAPKPIFLMTKGETGLTALIDSGQLPPTPHLPEIENWGDLLAAIRFLETEPHEFKTLVIDTLGGAERMMHEYVCLRDYGGDWGEQGFTGYMRGYDVSLGDWRMFLNSLDDLRKKRGMTIFALMHTRVKTFKNPNGADYDRYAPEMHDKTWSVTKGWLDTILFGNYEVTVMSGNKETATGKKGKAAERASRIIYASSDNPTFDAKNRGGMDEIEMGDSAKEGWGNLAKAIIAGRKTVAEAPEVTSEAS